MFGLHTGSGAQRDDEEGASAVEYAILIGLIAIAIVGAVSGLGNKLKGTFNGATGYLNGATAGNGVVNNDDGHDGHGGH